MISLMRQEQSFEHKVQAHRQLSQVAEVRTNRKMRGDVE